MPVRSIDFNGQRAWRKTYPRGGRRRVSLGLLDFLARILRMEPLRPPPHRTGADAMATEARRLRELRAQGVPVPEILAEEGASLVLQDTGPSLARCLRDAQGAPQRIDALTRAAIDAIGDAHRRGAYLGQPVPRNITYDGRTVFFIDFEEDPFEAMSLPQAQARDWVIFAYGMAKRYATRPQALTELLRTAFSGEPAGVGASVHSVGARLLRLARAIAPFGSSARALAQSIVVLFAASL